MVLEALDEEEEDDPLEQNDFAVDNEADLHEDT